MPSFYAAAILASASFAFAAPTEKRGVQFRVDQVASGHKIRNGPLDMLATYGKYNMAPPEAVSKAAAAQEGTVPATPGPNDESYLSPVQIGDQTFNLDFDTGSSDLWVFSTETSGSTAGHTLYDHSSGKLLNGYSWSIKYGDQSSSSGVVYTDKVSVGDVTAPSQAVEAATKVSAQFARQSGTDGLLGLAFSSINTVKPKQQTTFFDTVKDTLATPVFTADLKKGQAGSYDFGFIDQSKYTGEIAYADVDSSAGFWLFEAGAASSGGQSLGSIGQAIMDTGTSLFYAPEGIVDAYYSQVQSAQLDQQQGGYTFDCSAQLPDLTVEIGGQTFTTPGSFINYAPLDQSGQTCFGGIQASTGLPASILGDVFMKNFFVVFDPQGPRLGVANQ